ncbi:MAG: PH domain-containing protein [Patescibacteria group bacterium]
MISLKEHEVIVVVARKHWMVMASVATGITLLFFVPVIIFWLDSANIAVLKKYSIFLSSLYWLVLLIIFYIEFLRIWLDALVVTSSRVIVIEQHSLFHREVSEFGVERVQDVSVETIGIVASFFNFGTITVHTAGETNFVISQVANPMEVKDRVLAIARKK